MTWPAPVEVTSLLKKSGQVALDVNGNGALYFDPDNARQRWEVTSIVVKTNQPATATIVPVVHILLNTADVTVPSDGNNRGASWSGNEDTFQGKVDVGPCDFLTISFTPPAGAPGNPGTPALFPSTTTWPGGSVYPSAGVAGSSVLSGVIASAVVSGSKYTRRA